MHFDQQDESMRELQSLIVKRQLGCRREFYEKELRRYINDYSSHARMIVTYIGNFFSFCEYSTKCTGMIPFLKEMDFLENYFLLEKMFCGDCFRLEKEFTVSDFAIPPFTVFALLREAAWNLVQFGEKAHIWIKTVIESEKVKITIRHDIPYECLADEKFRKDNTYGFWLLKERFRQVCEGRLERKALEDGRMENTIMLSKMKADEQGPVFIWF